MRSHQTQLGSEELGQVKQHTLQTDLLKGYRNSFQTASSEAKEGERSVFNMTETLGNLIDTEDPKYAKIKDEDFKAW